VWYTTTITTYHQTNPNETTKYGTLTFITTNTVVIVQELVKGCMMHSFPIAGNYWNSSHVASLEGKINHDEPWYCLEMHYHASNHDLLRCFLDIFMWSHHFVDVLHCNQKSKLLYLITLNKSSLIRIKK